MSAPQRWTDVLGIADDLAQFTRRVEEKLDPMERMTLDNLVLRLDVFIEQLPGVIQRELVHWFEVRQQETRDA
jgi:hypothetical protein